MKKYLLIILAFSSLALALTDTDADGVSDEKDLCPRVYARTETGCPTLAASTTFVSTNNCIADQLTKGKLLATVLPSCDKNSTTCTLISKIVGFQSCDPIFPIIFDNKGIPLIRGAVYIVDYTQ